jgi:hypothetical protein
VSNSLHFFVLDADFLIPVSTLSHWFWLATWTLGDATSWCSNSAILQLKALLGQYVYFNFFSLTWSCFSRCIYKVSTL